MRRGFDIFFTLGASQVLLLPDRVRWIIQFQFGKTLRTSRDAGVVLADPERPKTCAWRGVSTCPGAAAHQGWDLSLGPLFPVVEDDGEQGHTSMTAPRMKAGFQRHLRVV
ncbi:unnamed protein product, partial [Ectocarpus sp. 12 AP-2014]